MSAEQSELFRRYVRARFFMYQDIYTNGKTLRILPEAMNVLKMRFSQPSVSRLFAASASRRDQQTNEITAI